jgi:hypothetical protein
MHIFKKLMCFNSLDAGGRFNGIFPTREEGLHGFSLFLPKKYKK